MIELSTINNYRLPELICIPHEQGLNTYLDLLCSAITKAGRVSVRVPSIQLAVIEDYPVVWIHWPEALTEYRSPSASELETYRELLARYCQHGILVWTVHNLYRHCMQNDRGFNDLYNLVAHYADVQIHHGNHSVELVRERFGDSGAVIRVVGHGGYWNLLGGLCRDEARKRLGVEKHSKLLLVFGTLRDSQEYEIALHAARAGWYVLITSPLPYIRKRHRLQIWRQKWLASNRVRVLAKTVPDNEVDMVVKACDAVLIARKDCLNSGNVFLGMTFGRAIIGPNVGNVGEVLNLTGNWVFNPADKKDMRRVFREAYESDLDAPGQRNRQWLEKHGRWEDIAATAISAIAEVREKRRVNTNE
jgi:hypothetical protein